MTVLERLPDVQRSTGCTEPAAVALAAAVAARAAGGPPRRIDVRCDPGTYRNGQRAGVPGAGGRAGLDLAAALGALAGDADARLDVLADITPADVAAAVALVERGAVRVTCRDADQLAIDVVVEADGGPQESRGEVWVRGEHTRVVAILRDGAPVALPAWALERAAHAAPPATLAEALALANALTPDDERALLRALELDVGAALAAGRPPSGWSAGERPRADPAHEAEAMAAAASYARMTGERVTVVTSGWSGNQGLVAALPIQALADALGAPPRARARALATSYLVGRLLRDAAPSPVCHATVAASAGAAAGCARLLGADGAAVERACHLVLASAGAPACDGAKPACALRVGLAAAQAVRCARRALEPDGRDIEGGLVGRTLEETARRLAAFARQLGGGDAPCRV